MTYGLMGGFRALHHTDEKGVIYGKILSNLEVDVIKVEKTGGDPTHRIPPFYNDEPNLDKSLCWDSFNTNKRSITRDLENIQEQDSTKKLPKEKGVRILYSEFV